MALIDEIKAERAKLKGKTPKEKFHYYWYYYKFHFIITIICLSTLGVFIYEMATQKKSQFNVAFVNAATVAEAGEFNRAITEALNIDTDNYEIRIDDSTFIDEVNQSNENNYYAIQKLSVLMLTSDLDVTIMNTSLIRSYAYMLAYEDLRDVLSEEQLKKYEPYFYYIDYAVYEKIQKLQEEGKAFEEDYPDPKQPDKMENPIPVGIYIWDAKLLRKYYIFEQDSVLSIPSGATHRESALKFLDFLFSENDI